VRPRPKGVRCRVLSRRPSDYWSVRSVRVGFRSNRVASPETGAAGAASQELRQAARPPQTVVTGGWFPIGRLGAATRRGAGEGDFGVMTRGWSRSLLRAGALQRRRRTIPAGWGRAVQNAQAGYAIKTGRPLSRSTGGGAAGSARGRLGPACAAAVRAAHSELAPSEMIQRHGQDQAECTARSGRGTHLRAGTPK